MADEGRNLASCKDGKCRVTVKPGDRITVPAATGGTRIMIKSISATEITIQQDGYGGGTMTATFYAPGPTGFGSGKLVVGFINIVAGQAIMQIDV